MSYLDTVTQKRLEAAKNKEVQDSLKELRKIQQMTALTAGSQKPTVVLTDQTDLGDKMKEHTTKVTEAISALNRGDMGKEQLAALKTVETALKQLEKGQLSALSDVVSAVERLDLNPTITVSAPNVTVQPTPVDLSVLETTLRDVFTPPKTNIDLSCYRAQDLRESGDIQYVGFVNPEGNWYIIENHVRENKMRYLFGMSDYPSAWSKASRYKYYLLNEAVNAVRS